MGYMHCLGYCYACGKPFHFNPNYVPSLRDEQGVRQPICEACITYANKKRKEMKLVPFAIHPQAYEPEEVE